MALATKEEAIGELKKIDFNKEDPYLCLAYLSKDCNCYCNGKGYRQDNGTIPHCDEYFPQIFFWRPDMIELTKRLSHLFKITSDSSFH